jgi:RhtB (resistance to homoserine/threonine) family protein
MPRRYREGEVMWAPACCDDLDVHVLPFLAVSAIVVITPGVDMALVTKNALLHGRRAAQMTAVGVNLGIFFWTIAAALGLAAVIAASAAAFTAIKLAGALYLIYLGLQALRAARGAAARSAPVTRAAIGRRAALRQGLTSNLLNPKIAVFFTSLLPQFVDANRASPQDLLLLGVMFNGMGVVWLLGYATVAARARNALSRPRVKRAIDRISGVTLVALGTRIALEHRH